VEAPIEESRITDKTTVPTAANEPKLGSIMWAILIVAALAEISYGMVNFSATPVYVVSLGLDKSFIGIISMSYLSANPPSKPRLVFSETAWAESVCWYSLHWSLCLPLSQPYLLTTYIHIGKFPL